MPCWQLWVQALIPCREDVPEMTWHGKPLIQPLRVVSEYTVASQDVDPRGLPVMAGDGKQGGTVKDIWIDSAEMMFRYLEVEIAGGKTVLLPMMFSSDSQKSS